jgi:uroporphyrinogen-III decarboxylase
MGKMTEIIVDYDREIARASKDIMGIQGNIANAGIVGKDFFDEYIKGYEKIVIDAIHETGCRTIYHNCGKARVLLECYRDLGMTAWETVADHPVGDTSISMAKRVLGDQMTLIGNLDQVDFLKHAKIEEICDRTKQIVEDGKSGGRFIFSCSDYLEVGTPIENVKAVVDTVNSYAVY